MAAISEARAAETRAILARHAALMAKIRGEDKGRPEPGKQYRLTGASGVPSIASGNTWAESEVKPIQK